VKILTLGILGIVFLIINLLLRKLLTYIRSKARVVGLVNRYFPLVEMVFWALFIFWSCDVLFNGSPFYPYLIFLLIVLVVVFFSWFFLRDYIAGIQLKSRYNFAAGQSFKSSRVSGVVKKNRLLYLEVKADNGSDFRIPYSKIDQSSIEMNIQEKTGGESIIKVWLSQNWDEAIATKKIAELVLNSPWSSHKSHPIIYVREAENELKCYEISCITHGDQAVRKIKELIEKELSSPNK